MLEPGFKNNLSARYNNKPIRIRTEEGYNIRRFLNKEWNDNFTFSGLVTEILFVNINGIDGSYVIWIDEDSLKLVEP